MRPALRRFAIWILAGSDRAPFSVRLAAAATALSGLVTVLAFFTYRLWFPDLLAGRGGWLLPLTAGLTLVGGAPIIATFLVIVRQQRETNAELHVLSMTDPLTGLPNRRTFVLHVSRHLADAPQSGAFLLIDVDDFKSVNDSHGHPTGDAALRQIAQTMRGALREGDLLARVGGEEFGAYLPGADADTAAEVAERLRRAVRCESRVQGVRGKPVELSISVGGVLSPFEPIFESVYRIADDALYKAKQDGRDRVVLRTGRPANLASG